jgi:predicted phosphodiesterase
MPAGHEVSLASVAAFFWLADVDVGVVSRFGPVSVSRGASAGVAASARDGSRSIGSTPARLPQAKTKTPKNKDDRIGWDANARARASQSLAVSSRRRSARDCARAFGYTLTQMLTRVGLIGDIHCEVARLRQVLEHFRACSIETVLAVGDIADGPGDLGETCAMLESAGVLAVAGNHERWLLSGQMRELPDATPLATVTPRIRKFLSALPKTRSFETPRGPALLCHGLGEDDMATVRPDDYGYQLEENRALWELVEGGTVRFAINGHSHRVMLRNISGLTILNAGTLHEKPRSVCSVADFDEGYMQIYDLEGGHTAAAERWTFEQASRPHL